MFSFSSLGNTPSSLQPTRISNPLPNHTASQHLSCHSTLIHCPIFCDQSLQSPSASLLLSPGILSPILTNAIFLPLPHLHLLWLYVTGAERKATLTRHSLDMRLSLRAAQQAFWFSQVIQSPPQGFFTPSS